MLSAAVRGELASFEAEVRERVGRQRRLREAGEAVPSSEVDAAARRFRYDWNLLSADDLNGWLGSWGLSVEVWMGHVERTLLADGSPGTTQTPSEDDVADACAVDAICSGRLETFAARLAARAAVATQSDVSSPKTPPALPELLVSLLGTPADRLSIRAAELAGLEQPFEVFSREAVTQEELEKEVEAHSIEWLRADCDCVEFPVEQAAREAALLVREDGLPLAEAAAAAGLPVRASRFYLDAAEPELEAQLTSAAEGELIGPIGARSVWLLVLVRAKVPPELGDAEVRRRAESRVRRRAVERQVERMVRWSRIG